MATIDDLKNSITDIPEDRGMELILDTRKKRMSYKKRKKKSKKRRKKSPPKLNRKQAQAVLEMLKEQGEIDE